MSRLRRRIKNVRFFAGCSRKRRNDQRDFISAFPTVAVRAEISRSTEATAICFFPLSFAASSRDALLAKYVVPRFLSFPSRLLSRGKSTRRVKSGRRFLLRPRDTSAKSQQRRARVASAIRKRPRRRIERRFESSRHHLRRATKARPRCLLIANGREQTRRPCLPIITYVNVEIREFLQRGSC